MGSEIAMLDCSAVEWLEISTNGDFMRSILLIFVALLPIWSLDAQDLQSENTGVAALLKRKMNRPSTPMRNPASLDTVVCVGTSSSGNKYDVELTWIGRQESLVAVLDKNKSSFLVASLTAYQQGESIDPISGKKTGFTRFWESRGDRMRIQIVESELTTASLVAPEAAALSCRLKDN